MLTSDAIKSIVISLGADKCGIAGIDRFSSAPAWFRPIDVYSKCKSALGVSILQPSMIKPE